MFADQIFGFFAIVDTARAALLEEQRFVFTRGKIETRHREMRLLRALKRRALMSRRVWPLVWPTVPVRTKQAQIG